MSDKTVSTAASEAEVRVSSKGAAGQIELNRPKALNSLSHGMVLAIEAALEEWRSDDSISQVIISSASQKAFCAGGDVRAMRELQLAGEVAQADKFFFDEYRMNATIADYPKPIVALVNGINMGGGMGLSLHAQYRVYSQAAWAAMPEAAIGFNADVGVSWAAQRVVGTIGRPAPEIATFMGITGYRAKLADALYCGIATHYVPLENFPALIDAIASRGVAAALNQYAEQPPAEEGWLEKNIADISRVFGLDTWAEMAAKLDSPEISEEFADQVHSLVAEASPASLVAIAELYRANRVAKTIQAGLDNEYELGKLLRREPNFAEGVRAVLVDKSHDAQFQPATAAAVDANKYRAVLS